MKPDSSTNRKALLAIAFVGTVLNSELPSLSENNTEPVSTPGQTTFKNSAIRNLVTSNDGTPEIMAYYLLRLANGYLDGSDKQRLEARYSTINPSTKNNQFFNLKGSENILVSWADKISSEECGTAGEPVHKPTANEARLADLAIDEALKLLNKSAENFERLNMIFIASRLYEQSANTDGTKKCGIELEQAIRSAEKSSTVLEKTIPDKTILAIFSILNSMAYGVVPIHTPDQDASESPQAKDRVVYHPTEKEIEESEELKLRALALVERLQTTDHVRRKAHRDLAIWYNKVGKPNLAEKQKQILYELIGSKDDRLLYPRQLGCGNYVWWEWDKNLFAVECGMG